MTHLPAITLPAGKTPPERGRRLADSLPRARLVEIARSDTLILLGRAVASARLVRDFMATSRAPAPANGHCRGEPAPPPSHGAENPPTPDLERTPR
jgi:hypothetical protein